MAPCNKQNRHFGKSGEKKGIGTHVGGGAGGSQDVQVSQADK